MCHDLPHGTASHAALLGLSCKQGERSGLNLHLNADGETVTLNFWLTSSSCLYWKPCVASTPPFSQQKFWLGTESSMFFLTMVPFYSNMCQSALKVWQPSQYIMQCEYPFTFAQEVLKSYIRSPTSWGDNTDFSPVRCNKTNDTHLNDLWFVQGHTVLSWSPIQTPARVVWSWCSVQLYPATRWPCVCWQLQAKQSHTKVGLVLFKLDKFCIWQHN